MGLIPGSGRSPGEGNGTPTPVLLPGESHGQRSRVDYRPWGGEVRHDWATSLSLFTLMHWTRKWQSSVLAWRIPGTEEPGGLPSMGSHRVRHDSRDSAAAAARVRGRVALVVKNHLPMQETWDVGLIPGSGWSSGEGNGNALQCSCLENPMDRGAWWATIHGVPQSRTWPKQLSTRTQEQGMKAA